MDAKTNVEAANKARAELAPIGTSGMVGGVWRDWIVVRGPGGVEQLMTFGAAAELRNWLTATLLEADVAFAEATMPTSCRRPVWDMLTPDQKQAKVFADLEPQKWGPEARAARAAAWEKTVTTAKAEAPVSGGSDVA